MRALLIPQDLFEAVTEVDVERDARKMSTVIGSEYIERVVVGSIVTRARFPFVLVVDEEGQFNPAKQKNIRASLLYGSDLHGGIIVGDALLVGEGMTDEGPDFIDLPEHVTVNNLGHYLLDPTEASTEALMGG